MQVRPRRASSEAAVSRARWFWGGRCTARGWASNLARRPVQYQSQVLVKGATLCGGRVLACLLKKIRDGTETILRMQAVPYK